MSEFMNKLMLDVCRMTKKGLDKTLPGHAVGVVVFGGDIDLTVVHVLEEKPFNNKKNSKPSATQTFKTSKF